MRGHSSCCENTLWKTQALCWVRNMEKSVKHDEKLGNNFRGLRSLCWQRGARWGESPPLHQAKCNEVQRSCFWWVPVLWKHLRSFSGCKAISTLWKAQCFVVGRWVSVLFVKLHVPDNPFSQHKPLESLLGNGFIPRSRMMAGLEVKYPQAMCIITIRTAKR